MILAALLALCAQDVVPLPDRPPLGAPDEQRWQLVDGVFVIVDEQILTRAQLLKDIAQFQGRGAATTEQELAQAQRYILGQRVRQKVKVQAGQDLGLDPKAIEQSLTNLFDRRIEEAGGSAELAETFRAEKADSLQVRDAWRQELYALTWERMMSGEEPGPDGRYRRDRYVRPGLRLFLHRHALETPEQWGELGGKAAVVRFQELILPFEGAADEAGARSRTEDLRQAVLEGADLDRLIEENGANKDTFGRDQVPQALLPRLEESEPVLARFLREASTGELSEVYRARGGRARAWAFSRLLERVPGEEPDFERLDAQLALAERGREMLDAWHKEEALKKRIDSAYIWPPELNPKVEDAGASEEALRLESGR